MIQKTLISNDTSLTHTTQTTVKKYKKRMHCNKIMTSLDESRLICRICCKTKTKWKQNY